MQGFPLWVALYCDIAVISPGKHSVRELALATPVVRFAVLANYIDPFSHIPAHVFQNQPWASYFN